MGVNAPTGFKGWWGQASYFAAAQAQPKIFTCPSDNNQQPTQNGVFVIYYCDATSLVFTGGYYPNPTGNLFGRTNYVPSGGAIGAGTDSFWGQYAGPFTDLSQNPIGALPDGTSNTLFFCETLGGNKNKDFAAGWMGSGSFATAWGVTDVNNANWYQLSSKHTAVALMGWGDGHVSPVRQNIATTFAFDTQYYSWIRASGFADGGVIDSGSIGN
jgi:hypothetical protein